MEGYAQLYADAAWFGLASKNFVRLAGQDVKGWLQGQVTQDLRDLVAGESAEACLLKATGQIEAVLQIHLDEGGAWIWASDPAPLLQRVERFVVMEDVRAVDHDFDAASLQGPEASARVANLTEHTRSDVLTAKAAGAPSVFLRSRRTGPGGWDVLYPAGKEPQARQALGDPAAASEETLWLAMLEAGIPLQGVDIEAKTLPPELGPRFEHRHVSYKKGCYSGHEVVMRIHSRGHTNRTWLPLRAQTPLAACATLASADGSEAGHVTRFAVSPRLGVLGAGYVRNAWAEPGTSLRAEGVEVVVGSWTSG